jgi:pimeloyl-ACP methyl ester carboxylesterase
MGKTHGAEWVQSSDDFLVVLRRVIDVLLPDERFLLVGSSFGAHLARGLVHGLASMLDGVLLSVPSAAYPPQHRETEPRTIILRDATLAARLPTSPILDREYNATVVWENEHLVAYAEMLSAIPEADTTFLDKLRRDRSFSFDPDRPPSPLAAPSLFILGRQDAQVGYKQQLALIENYSRATVGLIDGAGHWVWGERPDLCKALADDWLDRVEEWTRAGRPQ